MDRSFKGTLEMADGSRIAARLYLGERTLTLAGAGGSLGSWEFQEVRIERSGSTRFRLELGDDRATFIPDEAVDFAYTAPAWVEAHQPKPRGAFQRLIAEGTERLSNRFRQSSARRRATRLARSEEHQHTWSEQRIPGGLVRRVCVECEHVSIDLTEQRDVEPIAGDQQVPRTADRP
jgi:hypothetical protein